MEKDVISFEIDGKQKESFHMTCIKNHEGMSDVLRRSVESYISEHKPRFTQVA